MQYIHEVSAISKMFPITGAWVGQVELLGAIYLAVLPNMNLLMRQSTDRCYVPTNMLHLDVGFFLWDANLRDLAIFSCLMYIVIGSVQDIILLYGM